jgi:hypothetical protein
LAENGKSEDVGALYALLDLGRQTKKITVEGIDLVIKKLSFGEEKSIAHLTGEMAQRGVPVDTCQREYAKQVVVSGTADPVFDEISIEQIPFPIVTSIATEIIDFSKGLEKNS